MGGGDLHRVLRVPIRLAGPSQVHRLQEGRAADDLAGMAAGAGEQHGQGQPDAAGVERAPAARAAAPAARTGAGPSRPPAPAPARRRPACRAAANI